MTVTVADALAVPPDPVQARENVLEVINAPLDWLPEIALLPDHAPEARQELASVDDQLRVEELPLITEVGFAVSDTMGTGAVTVTLADALAVPPSPVQTMAKVLELVNTPLDWLPEVALMPSHAPEAVQELASVDDQVRMEESPLTTEVGFAVSDTVGSGGGGVLTVTVVEAPALPPEPVQRSAKVLVLVNVPLD